MTVYKDNIALVKEPVYWSVQAGLSEITYDQLPNGLFPESPFLLLHDVAILYQRYNNNVFSGEKYFNDKIMEQLEQAAKKEFLYGEVDKDISEDIQ
mgnify:CR=1 FL=1